MIPDRQVWITGIGLVSSLGEGGAAHLAALGDSSGRAIIDRDTFAPYPVHPLAAIDFSKQIAKTSDLRQMETWQRLGVYCAGLALADAGLAGEADLLETVHLAVAAGNGERDVALDSRILAELENAQSPEVQLNTALASGLRPTLYLGELSNLLAGNISIIHKATGSSRTFKGEEMAGVAAIENAVRRIHAGQGDIFLAGGALNAERADLLLGYELGHHLWPQDYRPVWARGEIGGGFIPGSMGAFLVLEASAHAQARGRKPYARIAHVASDRSRRRPGAAAAAMLSLIDQIGGDLGGGQLAVLSGASGFEPVTSDELSGLAALETRGTLPRVRAYGSRIGHGVEAQFPAGIALAALALAAGTFFPPFDDSGIERTFDGAPDRILVTGLGHWRGEGIGLVMRPEDV